MLLASTYATARMTEVGTVFMTYLRWTAAFLFLVSAGAQTARFDGDYSGVLGPLHLKLHLTTGGSGALEGTLDSIDQNAKGLPCSNFERKEKTLAFEVPSVGGKWHGTMSEDGATLSGSWSQGTEMPLVFRRDQSFSAAATPSRVDGIWRGNIEAPGATLRIQVQVKSDSSGKEYCSVDSLDQGAMGLPCDNVLLRGNTFSFEVPLVHGRWSGTLNESGNELKGTWSQGSDLPLSLTRQSTALAPKKPEPPKYDPAMVAIPVIELKNVIDHDIESALKSGALAPSTHGGIVIGVVQHGGRRIFAYGTAKEDQLFEIGSISKTFTGLILAQMVEQHKVKFDDPVRDLLPPGTVAKPEGTEITLLDLATQHSGLPRMPDNFHPADQQDPYVDYHATNLYQFIKLHGVAKPANPSFLYSNLGFGLLGQALANRAAAAYPDLLRDEVTTPLNLKDTAIKLSPEQEKRFAQGHDAKHQDAHPWNLDAFAGAGAIRSTANDMLSYLEAQLHSDTVKPTGSSTGVTTLSKALELSHQIRADVGPTMKIALAWLYVIKTGDYWHNGGTGGFSSYVAFNPKDDDATVVLFNTTLGENGSFADRVGEHVMERLSGRPAVSLGN